MIFEIKEQNGGIYATVSGRLDTPASVLAQEEMAPLMENADKEIVLDFARLDYISSSGLRLLLTLRKQAAARGGNVIIEHVSEEILKVLTMTGFVNIFEVRGFKEP